MSSKRIISQVRFLLSEANGPISTYVIKLYLDSHTRNGCSIHKLSSLLGKCIDLESVGHVYQQKDRLSKHQHGYAFKSTSRYSLWQLKGRI